jgi:hypothetical protein
VRERTSFACLMGLNCLEARGSFPTPPTYCMGNKVSLSCSREAEESDSFLPVSVINRRL